MLGFDVASKIAQNLFKNHVSKTPVLETSKKINGLQQGFEYETKGYTCVCVWEREREKVRERERERGRGRKWKWEIVSWTAFGSNKKLKSDISSKARQAVVVVVV